MAATTPQQQQQQQYPSQQPPQQQPPPAQPQQPTTAAQKLAQINEQTWLSMGNLAELMTDYDKATSCYESALRHNPYSIPALTQIASLCRGREQFGRAVEYFKRILAIQENNGETWAALGHCYLMMDNLQDAYHAYQQALYHLSNPKDPKLWYGIGILYDRYGSLEHAEEAFSAVMKMDPKFEKANEIYFRLGIIYKQQQKYDLSLQCFRYILHSPPRPLTEPDIWFQTGHVYEQQKEYELAKEAYERVLAENPDHAKVLQQLGWLYHQQNTSFCNQNLAIQYLTRSLKSDSNDAQSWYLLGRCYMAEQNYNKAYEAYQQAVYRDARNPTFWCSIGVLYYQINQYRDALDAYSRAIRLNPYISEVWYDLGTLYESCNNQVQDALDAYQRAADLDPSNPHIKQRLELLRKSQSVQSSQIAGSAPAPRDVSNPNQYQNGPGSQPLNGAPFSQPGSGTALSSMSAYNTNVGGSRAAEERASTPMLPPNVHENSNGQNRDLPALSGQPSSRAANMHAAPQPTTAASDDVRIPGIGGGQAPAPSERSQMNPIMTENEAPRDRRTPPPTSLPYQQGPHVDQRAAAASHHPYTAKPVPSEETRPMSSPKQHGPEANRAAPHPLSSRHSWQQPGASPQHPHPSPRPESTASPRNAPVAPHHPAEGAPAQRPPVPYEGNDPAHAHYGARPAEPSAYSRPEYAPESAQQQLPPMKSEEPMATEQTRPSSTERAPAPALAPTPEAPTEKPAPAEKSPVTEEPAQPAKPQEEDNRVSTAPKDTSAPESNTQVPNDIVAAKEEPTASQVPGAPQTSASTRNIDEDYDESAASTLLSMGNAIQNQETQKRTYPGEDNESPQESKRPRQSEILKDETTAPKQEVKEEQTPKDEAVPMEGQEQTSPSKPVSPPAAQQEPEKPSEQQQQQPPNQQQGEPMDTEPAPQEKTEASAAEDGKEEGEVSEKDH